MTFLPIAERELRVAARKRSTFWLRVAAAGGNHVSASTLLQVEVSMDRTTLARALDLADRLAVHFQVQLALAQ